MYTAVRPAPIVLCSLALMLAGCRDATRPTPVVAAPNFTQRSDAPDDENGPVVTIDHQVPHQSTVAGNAGELVHLFLRERVRNDIDERARTAVLMIHGRSTPVLAGMELRYGDYDWALWLARSGGFDVFMLDFQGSGRSPRPRMDDPCNVPLGQQRSLLIPNPLATTCSPSYAATLNTTGSDLDELDAAVEYIRVLRRVDKVHLIGWSQASFRIGPYAVQHPDKVASLFFFGPIFNTGFTRTPPPSEPTPMTLTTRADLFTSNAGTTGWSTCAGQREPGIEDVIWAAIMENDALGHTWGPPAAGAPEGSPPEGVMRVRQAILSGWNSQLASQLTVPTLIIRGEFDTGLGGRQDVAELYRLVRNDNKLRFTVQCAGHFMNWEKQRWILHQISKEWIKHGRVDGFDQGEFRVDMEGNLTAEHPGVVR
jgi:pimeloyl-ACP methyl ester carboxylesterase